MSTKSASGSLGLTVKSDKVDEEEVLVGRENRAWCCGEKKLRNRGKRFHRHCKEE